MCRLREGDMGELARLRGVEPRNILELALEKKLPVIMTYLSRGKWQVAKVLITTIGATQFNIQVSPRKKPQPINIEVGQVVGLSFKYKYGKFIFDAAVLGLEPSAQNPSGGMMVLVMPQYIEMASRRSYYRVSVPASLEVNIKLWHRRPENGHSQPIPDRASWDAQLSDISAGGAQIALSAECGPDFRVGQFIRLQFTPLPYEELLDFCAQIRNIRSTADQQHLCLGVQLVGLEASAEGRAVLQRLCHVVEQYYQINQSTIKQQDFQTTHIDR